MPSAPTKSLIEWDQPNSKRLIHFDAIEAPKASGKSPSTLEESWRRSRIASCFGSWVIWYGDLWRSQLGTEKHPFYSFRRKKRQQSWFWLRLRNCPVKHLGPGIKDVTDFNKCDIHSVVHKFWSHKKVPGALIPCQVQGVWLRILTATF